MSVNQQASSSPFASGAEQQASTFWAAVPAVPNGRVMVASS
jgi:hypothetical protein